MEEFGKDEHEERVSTSIQRKWFWLGLVEALPMIGGFVASLFYSVFFPYDFFSLGVILSLLIAWRLKDKSPDPPIHLDAHP